MEKDFLLLYSGGMDSTTALYHFETRIAKAISFDYGSKHNQREIAFAKDNCQNLGIPHQVVKLDFNELGIKSNLLLQGGEIPTSEQNLQKTVVPFRNGIMLSIAAAIAESEGISQILLSNHKGDLETYPDCRPSFISYMQYAFMMGLYTPVGIYSPFQDLSKEEIAGIAELHDYPIWNSYSCYKGGETHCGECNTCKERKKALGKYDKTQYLK